ncbi:MAG: UDP-N-acetylmuramoyl-L-alanine--D-glutamate ligase [Candidatus Kapabacteria bacterium]|nr:UDP-N-acetylmuramoyl-L-alanine--D-glutamate ligase [Candidatus Kapabacteria bacterium]
MNITVIGAAKSGKSAAILAKKLGNSVFVSESGNIEKYKYTINDFDIAEISYEFGGNTERCFENCDLIITSPGVPPSSWVMIEAKKRNLKVIGEIEYAFQNLKGNKIVAITGTNGKTTTTSLINFILKTAGKKTILAGNIGNPLCDFVLSLTGGEIIVIEMSSYQLDTIDTFTPDIALILNITPDHLGYHGSFEHYTDAKWKITLNQSKENLLILNYDDEALGGTHNKSANVEYFSLSPIANGIYSENGKIVLINQHNRTEELMLTKDIRLPGVHNLYNSMAAVLAARRLEIRNEDIRDALMNFSGVEHRLEFVRNFRNVEYINDSKATNINATWFALSSYSVPIIWIAGGRGDNNDYSALNTVVSKNVKTIICFGEDQDKIYNYFSPTTKCIKASTMENAVKFAQNDASENEIVLFAPACKSFDMFVNFEHRGEVYKKIVNSLV